jgi:hypothetical protein
MKIHKTKRYVRYRIRDPKEFIKSSFRVHDIGRPGHSKRIAGRLKSTGEWATQAILISKEDYEKGYRVKIVNGRPTIVKVK